jgi:hypothetical protein
VRLTGIAPTDMAVWIFFGKMSASLLFEQVEMVFCRQAEEAERQVRVFELSFVLKRIAVEP